MHEALRMNRADFTSSRLHLDDGWTMNIGPRIVLGFERSLGSVAKAKRSIGAFGMELDLEFSTCSYLRWVQDGPVVPVRVQGTGYERSVRSREFRERSSDALREGTRLASMVNRAMAPIGVDAWTSGALRTRGTLYFHVMSCPE